MNSSKIKLYKTTFLIAAIYDLVIGATFLFFSAALYSALGISEARPDQAYLALLGAFVLVIAYAYWKIYRGDLRDNLDLITIGALYKIAYALVAFWFYFTGGAPHVAFVFVFGIADIIFFAIMMQCRAYVGAQAKETVMAAA